MNKAIQKTKKVNNEITKLRLKIARKTKQRKHWFCRLKDINNAKSKNILKIKKNKKEIKYTKETFETLFDIIIDFSLFAFLFFNALLTLINDFVVDEIVATC